MPDPSPPSLLRVALRPRMLAILAVLLVAAVVCSRLGVWQLDRAQERGELAERHRAAELEAMEPAWLGEALRPQSRFPAELVGRKVRVQGSFEDGQLLVRDRVVEGRDGFLVLTPFRVADDGTARGAGDGAGDAAGGEAGDGATGPAVVPVVRGWVAAGEDGEPEPSEAALEPPVGTVDLLGYLQASEAAGELDASAGRTDAVSSGALANVWAGPIYSAYLVQAEPAPPAGIEALPRPVLPGGGINLQNLFYALQWWIFGGFAVLLWWRLVRDERFAALEESEGGALPDEGPVPTAGGGAERDRAQGDREHRDQAERDQAQGDPERRDRAESRRGPVRPA